MSEPKSRRHFLKNASASLAGLGISSLEQSIGVPAYLKKLPSQTIQAGFIGLKGIGWSNLNAFKKHDDAEVIALADVDQNILSQRNADFQKNWKNSPALLEDYRKILENKDIDAIFINTPDHWHTLQLLHGLEAGKHVYVEKPLANSIQECLVLENMAKKFPQLKIQVGQQQRSGKHFQEAMQWLAQGELGKIRQVKCWIFNANKGAVPPEPDGPIPAGVNYDAWLGPAPSRPFNKNRFHFTFRWYWDYAGGLMTDWGVHLLDVALWGMKSPEPISVSGQGGKFAFPNDAMQTPDTMQVVYRFPEFLLSWEHTIGIGRGSYDREHGIAFIGENGTLVVDRKGWEVLAEFKKDEKGFRSVKINPVPFQSIQNEDRVDHMRNFIDAIKDGKPLACPLETASKVAKMAHLGNVAFRSGENIGWDAQNQKISASPEAQKFAQVQYRKPYSLPQIK
jgi:predicted dehydrogenase